MTDKPHNNPARIDMADIDDLITRLRESADLCLNEVETRREAVEVIERLRRENEILRAERAHTKAHYDFCIRVLTRIHSFISPKDVTLPDGRRFEFNNPAIEHEMLKALSDAIRAVPDELKKAESAQPEDEWRGY